MTKQQFKEELNRVFDDNLHTKQWHNIVDWTIITLIIISTIEIFLSTFDGISERYGNILRWVDIITQIFFTIEVTLRIWNADMLDPKYKGFVGRLRYCFSFYGLIDLLATYLFYLNYVVRIPVTIFKTLRVVRLLRVFRYMHSFQLLSKALKSKKNELLVSLNFLVIVTMLLSFVLFFVEHEVQPEVYGNGWSSVIWAFAQYIGDPGGFADMPPMTFCGKVVACLVGIMGIAIVAVPAGLVGSAFTDVMEEEKHEEKINENIQNLELAFERKLDRPTQLQLVPKYISVVELQTRLGMSMDDVIEAVISSENYRLINLATTRPAEDKAEDKMAVEYFPINRPYGFFVNRGSKVTIMCATAIADATMSWLGFYLSKIGGFNYISREIGSSRPFKSYYNHDGEDTVPLLKDYMDDLRILAPSEDCWVITLMASSGAQEPTYPTQLHLTYGLKKGDDTYDDPAITLNNIPLFDEMQKQLSEELSKIGLQMDCQKYFNNNSSKLYVRQWDYKPNAIGLRMAWSETIWSSNAAKLLICIADVFHSYLDKNHEWDDSVELKKKDVGYRGYTETQI